METMTTWDFVREGIVTTIPDFIALIIAMGIMVGYVIWKGQYHTKNATVRVFFIRNTRRFTTWLPHFLGKRRVRVMKRRQRRKRLPVNHLL